MSLLITMYTITWFTLLPYPHIYDPNLNSEVKCYLYGLLPRLQAICMSNLPSPVPLSPKFKHAYKKPAARVQITAPKPSKMSSIVVSSIYDEFAAMDIFTLSLPRKAQNRDTTGTYSPHRFPSYVLPPWSRPHRIPRPSLG